MLRKNERFCLLTLISLIFVSCGGGGSNVPSTSPIPIPEYSWETATPESVGLSPNKVNAALDYATTDGIYTQSTIIVKDEKIVGERYRSISQLEKNNIISNYPLLTESFLDTRLSNRNASSKVTSWSMGKSFTSIIFGIAEYKGLLSINSYASAHINEWLGDERANITIKNLLDMRSGLNRGCYSAIEPDEIGECTGSLGSSGGDIVIANNQLTGCINQTFNSSAHGPYNLDDQSSYYLYSNCDTMILGEIFYRATGQNINEYAQTNLFSKLDITADWWRDNSDGGQDNGNYLSYCCIDMTARDFIKFGQLLLNDGTWQGERILSISYIQQIKNLSTYGLKFWHAPSAYISPAPDPSISKIIYAAGFDGQYILIDFENNILISRNSLYYPALEVSSLKKVKTGDISTTNLPISLPAILTARASTRLFPSFSPFTMASRLYD